MDGNKIDKMNSSDLPADIQNTINQSFEAMKNSYSPYSHFPVGAAILSEDGSIFTGCNVENASYPVGICAEMAAIGKAVSAGHRDFRAIAISSTMKDKPISPCGACRQFIAEFGMDCDVYMLTTDRSYMKMTARELLPMGFSPKDLQASKAQSIPNGH